MQKVIAKAQAVFPQPSWGQTGSVFPQPPSLTGIATENGICQEPTQYPLRDLKDSAVERKILGEAFFLLLKHFSCSF